MFEIENHVSTSSICAPIALLEHLYANYTYLEFVTYLLEFKLFL